MVQAFQEKLKQQARQVRHVGGGEDEEGGDRRPKVPWESGFEMVSAALHLAHSGSHESWAY